MPEEIPFLNELLTIQITNSQYQELMNHYSGEPIIMNLLHMKSVPFHNTVFIPLDIYYHWKSSNVSSLILDLFDNNVHSTELFHDDPYIKRKSLEKTIIVTEIIELYYDEITNSYKE